MPKFRKKPVVIEAFQVTNPNMVKQSTEWPEWLCEAWESGVVGNTVSGSLTIETLEGTHNVSLNDYIIQGVKGELYPCKPDIFEATYDSAED